MLDSIEISGVRRAYESRPEELGKGSGGGIDWETVFKVVKAVVETGIKLGSNNTDDVPGVILVRIWNKDGKLNVNYRGVDSSADKGIEKGIQRFELSGDGSKYNAKLSAVA